ncbi:MAG: potassium transporter TrkG [Pseudomonadota bacterium]
MRLSVILSILSRLTIIIGACMLLSLSFSLYYGEGGARPIILSSFITISAGLIFYLIFRRTVQEITHKEGMLIVTFGWLTAGFFGALPFFFAKIFGDYSFESYVNSFFETISGFTTTGASVLGANIKIEDVPKGLLFWRSLTHWLGGMGIIVLALAILPILGVGGMQLFRREIPGPTKEKLKPRIRQTATTLWLVYLFLTVAETILLMFGGMNFFDAICHTFGTMATGGFSTRTDSVGAFSSRYIDIVVIVFMFLAGCNFSLHYLAIGTRFKAYFRSSEFKSYLGIILVATIGITTLIYFTGVYESIFDALRYGAFQTVSIITTTGFATADFGLWPVPAQLLLLLFMFIGGCAGSTGGSIKIVRLVLLVKYGYRELLKLIHPKLFAAVKFEGVVIQKDVLESIGGFFVLYMALFVVGSVIIALLGSDIVTSTSSVAATLGNIGPGLAKVGPADNYYHFSVPAKLVLSFCMVVGRLEIYTVLALLVPEFWKK